MSEKKEPRVSIMTVTPQQAENWLERNHPRNRKLREHKVRQYAADMEAGRWLLSTQVIAFNTKDELVNGQHTLHAILRSEASIRCVVLWGMPDPSMLTIDNGMKRSTDDQFSMSGRDYVRGAGATVRRLMIGGRTFQGRAISDLEVDEFMSKYAAAVAFAHKAVPAGRFAQAPVRAVVARAKIGRHPGEKLERFGEVLNTGIMAAGEDAAVLLRNFILGMKGGAAGSGTQRSKLYDMAESALAAFLKGQRVKRIDPAIEELFPVPGDKVWLAEAAPEPAMA